MITAIYDAAVALCAFQFALRLSLEVINKSVMQEEQFPQLLLKVWQWGCVAVDVINLSS